MSGDVEALAEVLGEHGAIGYDDVEGCECGAVMQTYDRHRAHVATALLASDWMKRHDAEVRAGGFEEGLSTAADRAEADE